MCFVIFGSRLDSGSRQTPQVRPIFESLWAPLPAAVVRSFTVVNTGDSSCRAGLVVDDPTVSPRVWRRRGRSDHGGRLHRALRMGTPPRWERPHTCARRPVCVLTSYCTVGQHIRFRASPPVVANVLNILFALVISVGIDLVRCRNV